MSKPSNNLLQLTKNAIHSAQELSRSQQNNQQTRDGANKLQDLLQAVASDPPNLPEIRPLLIFCETACRFLLNTTSATNARTSSVTLQDSTEPAEEDISTIERMLLTYAFIVEISLAIATTSSTANGTVLEAKFILEKHLEQVKSKTWNATEREHIATERDTLKGDLEAFERVSRHLSSIKGGHGQIMEIAQTAHPGIQQYLVHVRKMYQIVEYKFAQQDRLEEEKHCLKICLTVCGQTLVDSSRPMLKNFVSEKDTARILPADRGTGNIQKARDSDLERPSHDYVEFSSGGGGRQVIGLKHGVQTSIRAVTSGENSCQILGSFNDEDLQKCSLEMARARERNSGVEQKPQELRQNEDATVQSPMGQRAFVGNSAGPGPLRFENLHVGPGIHVDVWTPSGRIYGSFPNEVEYQDYLAERLKFAKYGPGHSLVDDQS